MPVGAWQRAPSLRVQLDRVGQVKIAAVGVADGVGVGAAVGGSVGAHQPASGFFQPEADLCATAA